MMKEITNQQQIMLLCTDTCYHLAAVYTHSQTNICVFVTSTLGAPYPFEGNDKE